MATPDVDWDDEETDTAGSAAMAAERTRRGIGALRDLSAQPPAPEVLAQLLEGIGAATKPSTSLLSDGARQRAQAVLVAGEALRGAHGHDPAGVERVARFVLGSPA